MAGLTKYSYIVLLVGTYYLSITETVSEIANSLPMMPRGQTRLEAQKQQAEMRAEELDGDAVHQRALLHDTYGGFLIVHHPTCPRRREMLEFHMLDRHGAQYVSW